MKRTTTIELVRGFALALPVLALASGCAGRKPVAEMARAEQAVRHAQTTSEAQRYAPLELSSAEAKLAAARHALAHRDYEDARRLAEQALTDAQLAEAQAESQMAREQASRTRLDIETLQAERLGADTVVIESETVRTRTSPATVVVERRIVPSSVVVERVSPPPTTVIVERPAPPTITTVIEREQSVVVVPE